MLFLLEVLISACDSSSPTFHMIYSAYKLNKQGANTALSYCFPNSEPVHFSISGYTCCFLICVRVSQESGKVICYSHLFKNFPVCCDPQKGFNIVNEAEVDVFLEIPCFFDEPADAGNLTSGSSPFSISSLNIWKFTVPTFLKLGLENFE